MHVVNRLLHLVALGLAKLFDIALRLLEHGAFQVFLDLRAQLQEVVWPEVPRGTAANAEEVALAVAKTASHETQELGSKLNETREEMKSLKEDLKLIDEQADADAAETKAQLDANKEQLDKMSKQLGTRIPELQIDTHAGVKYLDGGILHLPVSNILKVAFSIDSSKVYPMMVDLITGSLPKGCEVELQSRAADPERFW